MVFGVSMFFFGENVFLGENMFVGEKIFFFGENMFLAENMFFMKSFSGEKIMLTFIVKINAICYIDLDVCFIKTVLINVICGINLVVCSIRQSKSTIYT